MKVPNQPRRYRPGGGNKTIKYKVPLTYNAGRNAIDVLCWNRWPNYDFIFGVPASGSRYYNDEAAFFQYRDTRRKRVKCGFYVDKRELAILARGFKILEKYSKKERKK